MKTLKSPVRIPRPSPVALGLGIAIGAVAVIVMNEVTESRETNSLKSSLREESREDTAYSGAR